MQCIDIYSARLLGIRHGPVKVERCTLPGLAMDLVDGTQMMHQAAEYRESQTRSAMMLAIESSISLHKRFEDMLLLIFWDSHTCIAYAEAYPNLIAFNTQ